MSLTITLPSSIERHLEMGWGDSLPRKATEALAMEGYRSGILSTGEIAEMLGTSVNEADGFLKERGLLIFESLEEIDLDSAKLEEILTK